MEIARINRLSPQFLQFKGAIDPNTGDKVFFPREQRIIFRDDSISQNTIETISILEEEPQLAKNS